MSMLEMDSEHAPKEDLSQIEDLLRWTCPYKTGHQLPVKLMLLPSA